MSGRENKVARAIKSFVENPFVNLVKGVILMLIGFSDASYKLRDDVSHGHLRLGHGLVIIGLFSILDALPHFIDGLKASERFLERREQGDRAREGDVGL